MTTQEFSTEFDVLYNNVTSNQAPGLNEYEKSVFLTKAAYQLVNEYFNNRTDGVGGGFDGSQKRQYDFSGLLRTEKLFNVNTFKERIDNTEKLDKRSKVFLFPENYFLAVNEILSDSKYQYSVLPISYSEYQRLMLKPYNFPVKKGAWRIFTDKKNCNYCREYITETNAYDEEVNTPIDYIIMTGWADQKRTLQVTIKSVGEDATTTEEDYMANNGIEITQITLKSGEHPKVYVNDDLLYFYTEYEGVYRWTKVTCDGGYSSDHKKYEAEVIVNSFDPSEVHDDGDTIELLKRGFALLPYYVANGGILSDSDEVYKVATHVDGFQMCSAPSKFTNFRTVDGNENTIGKTFTTKVIQVPMAEIIGKFTGEPEYKLRYVRTLKPIILDDLTNYGTDLTIGGITQETQCELPIETHQEILERAVTLAKIAWAGGTATTASQKNDN